MTVVGGSTDHLIVDRLGNVQADAVLEVRTLAGVTVTDLTPPTGWLGQAFPAGKARADGDGYFKFVVADTTGPVQVRTAAHTEGTDTFAAGPWLDVSGQIVPGTAVDQALAAMATDADIAAAVAAQATTDAATFARKDRLAVNALDYAVGDGVTNDTAALTAALAAADEVFIPAHATLLVSGVVVTGKRITGPGVIKKAAAAECALHLQGDGATIDGVVFAAETSTGQPNSDIKLGDGASNILITDCLFKSPHYSAISAAVDSDVSGVPYTTRVSGVQILGNRFVAGAGNYTRPLFLHSVDNAMIAGNLFRDTLFDAIRTRENSGYVTITDNQFINIGDPAWPDAQTRDAVDTYYSGAQLTISNNVVRTTACMGFDVKGYAPDGTGTNRVIITGNQISGCRYSGIKLLGDPNYDGLGGHKLITGVIVSNNIIQSCNQDNATGTGGVGNAAILLDGLFADVTITGNYIFANYGRGIYAHNADAGKTIAHDLLLAHNTVVNNGHASTATSGIHLAAVDYARVETNIVRNDTTMANAGTQTTGIFVTNADNGYTVTPRSMSIVGNVVRGHSSAQIQTDPNGNRATGIGTYRDNLVSTVFRGAWQHARLTSHGTTAPTSAEGAFAQGDRIFNATPGVLGTAGSQYTITGWLCTVSGTPGTWVEMRCPTGT